jgi:hypothetical protein
LLLDPAPLFVTPYTSIITPASASPAFPAVPFGDVSTAPLLSIPVCFHRPVSPHAPSNGSLQCAHCLELSRPRPNRSLRWCPGPTTPWSKNRALHMHPHVHFYRLSSILSCSLVQDRLLASLVASRTLFSSRICILLRSCNTTFVCLCTVLT